VTGIDLPLPVRTVAGVARDDEGEGGSLGVVIVTYNSAEVLPGLLDSLEAGLAGIERYEVVVVDNQSNDQSVSIAERHPIGARVVRNPVNGGYSAGINLAAAYLPPGADLLVLNPDIRLGPGAVAQLVARARDKAVGVAVPMVRNDDGTLATSLRREPSLGSTWWQAVLGPTLAGRLGVGEIIADPSYYRRGRRVEWATGAILLVSARARRRVGNWDESFFLYSEEVDYQRRVRRAGLDVVYVPEARVFHAGGDYKASPRLTSIMTSNQIRDYGRQHGPLPTLLFRGALLTFGLLRCWRSRAHRAVLRVAVSPLRPARDYISQKLE
jgi:GT2 family glycosyltransferase